MKRAGASRQVVARETRQLQQIVIGKRRRRDFGDLQDLAQSINDRGGLLQPVAITPDNKLIAGERRMKAWALSAFAKDPIPVFVCDVDSILAGEWDENAKRKDFTLSEQVALLEDLEPELKRRAAERQRSGGKADPKAKGEAKEQAAAIVGRSRKTLERAREIVHAAAEDPEQYGKLLADMDRTGRVNGPFRRLVNLREKARILQEPPALPGQGPYRTGVIDVPWASEPDKADHDPGGRAYFPYPTMTIAEVCALDVPSLLHEHASVWFWVTNFHLINGWAKVVLDAWQLKPVTMLTWLKNKIGQGERLRGQSEHVILAIRGKPPVIATGQGTWFEQLLDPEFGGAFGGKVREHSRKPDEFYDIVEKVSPAPTYFELFARRELPPNWHGHGNQVGTLKAREAA